MELLICARQMRGYAKLFTIFYLIPALQQSCEISTIAMSILQMKNLNHN